MADFSNLEDGVRHYVAHSMEKSMTLRDPGGWPEPDEVTDRIDEMPASELLSLMSMVHEELMAGRLLEPLA